MINNKTMFEFYKETLKEKSNTILNSCVIPLAEETLMVELFSDIKIFHPEHINIKSVVEFTKEDLKLLRISTPQSLFIASYINSYNTIKNNKKLATKAGMLNINLVHFSFILFTFNRLLWRAMIDEAYVFKNSIIGSLYVKCRENAICKPKMKWKESKANKQAILEKGGIPKVELEARIAAFNNEEYKGEEWIERHDPFNLIIKWRRSYYANLKVPTIKDFTLKLVRTSVGNGVVNALKDERDNNKLEDLLIKYHRYND